MVLILYFNPVLRLAFINQSIILFIQYTEVHFLCLHWVYGGALTNTDHGPNINVVDTIFGFCSVQILDSLGRWVTANRELIGVRRKYLTKESTF